MREPWNHNVHYHPLILRAVPPGCGAALDVGSGDGRLARALAARATSVTGVDRSPAMIAAARAASADVPNVRFAQADVLTPGALPAASFGFVSAVAVLHHLDMDVALPALARLVAPGGILYVLGLARDRSPADRLRSAAAVPAAQALRLRHGGKTDPAAMPVRNPEITWSQVRTTARTHLPGATYTRHLLWRYSLVWHNPAP
ncbi:class I SAM-dependent methyltransferase [Actinomadura flavalba]|uniref:class I SAM-dependent methyltransferase n=1 Tax=Actinomadura flavalba TaxID=1120938 RepID=UPI00037695C3|nr:class I SAM-dependent methyltransferase [Actinomadura flavalba]